MNQNRVFAGMGVICLITVVFAGCVGSGPLNPQVKTQSPTPSGTAVPVGNLVVTEEQNTATVYMNMSSLITVRLPENPTTGYQWNLTTTDGLRIMDSRYIPSDTTGKLAGSGGTHIWDISPVASGEQKIQAVYGRSWEQPAGNETTFSMTVIVA
jgi:inhibitor of cysteine peptidase